MSIIATRMLALRAKSNLDKWELRPSRYGVLDVFVEQSKEAGGILTPELIDKAKKSIGNTLETPVFDYDGTISIGNVRSATIADSENNSRMVTIVFATYAWGFTIVPSLYMNNEIGLQADFDTKMQKYLYKLGETLDSAGVAALEAKKTQIVRDTLGLYTFATNTIAAPFTKREEILGDLDPMQGGNDFYTPLDVAGNVGIQSLVNKLAEKGLYNETNKKLQFAGKEWHWSNRIANAADCYATGFAIPKGTVGLLTRFEREAILKSRARTGHEWDIETLPMLNIPVGTYYYEGVGDFSAIAGAASADMTRVIKQHYGFSVDVAFVIAENSAPTTRPSAIIKFEIEKEVVA